MSNPKKRLARLSAVPLVIPSAALWLVLGGCASTPGSSAGAGPRNTVAAEFPKPTELSKLGAQVAPPSTKLFENRGKEIDLWQLIGPLPSTTGYVEHRYDGPWGTHLRKIQASKPGAILLSEAMHCVARQYAHFYAAENAMPGSAVVNFAMARCGSIAHGIRANFYSGDVPEDMSDTEVLKRWNDNLAKTVATAVGAGQRLAGQGHGRIGKRLYFVAVSGERIAHIKPIAMVPSQAIVRVEGELYQPAGQIVASINHGRFGVRACDVDTGIALPRFAISCEVDADDKNAWLEIAAIPAGRVLGKVVARVLLSPNGELSTEYTRPRYEEEKEKDSSPVEMENAVVGILNSIRIRAGLGELQLSPSQSAAAAMLAPHYFAALAGLEPETYADMVVLGLQAGWQIEGDISRGYFTASTSLDTGDGGRLLANALEYPGGRRTLLDPKARWMAIGLLQLPKDAGLAAVFSTYAAFDHQAHASYVESALNRLNTLRAQHQKRPARHLKKLGQISSQIAKGMESGSLMGPAAMDQFMQAGIDTLRVGVQGWMVDTMELDSLELPQNMLEADSLAVGIVVAAMHDATSPWVRYRVIFLISQGEDSI